MHVLACAKALRLLQLQRSPKAVCNGKCRRSETAGWDPGVSQASHVSLQRAPYLEENQPFTICISCDCCVVDGWWLAAGQAAGSVWWVLGCGHAVFQEQVPKRDGLGTLFSSFSSGPVLLLASAQDKFSLGSSVWSCIVLQVKIVGNLSSSPAHHD